MEIKLFVLGSLLLILQGYCDESGSVETAGEVVHKRGDHQSHNFNADMRIQQVYSHSSSHMHHIDPSTIVFFVPGDLKQGSTMPIYFPRRKLSDSFAHLLPKEEVDSIPFKLQQLPNLLQRFGFPQGSPQATAMKETLEECERDPIRGETKFCATSMASMGDFIQMIFCSETRPRFISTIHLTESNALLQKYTIMGLNQIPAPKMVPCHTMPYPYTVFYCHYQESESKVYRVALTGENGDKVEAIAVCHMDTTLWSRNHMSFQVLGIEPGTSPVCHFFPADNFVWVPLQA